MTLQNFREKKIRELKESFSAPFFLPQQNSVSLDVDLLISSVLKKNRTWILFHREFILDEKMQSEISALVEKRKTGLPVAYILQKKEFFGTEFEVSPAVLIPKPDTEILVENALKIIQEKTESNPKKILQLCDMGCGSGCVGISILKFLAEKKIVPAEIFPRMFFADISPDALEIARANAKKILRAEIFSRSVFIQSNLFENFPRSKNGIFDVIISNPPYVPFSVTRELLQDGRSEPAVALCGDVKKDGTISDADDGISVIKNLILESKDFLNPRGKIILETGEYNAEKTESILKNSGFVQTKIFCDLEGQFRNVMGTISRKR